MMPTPSPQPQPPSAATTRSFTLFLVPPPPPMTITLQLGDGQQLQFTPPPERLLSSLLSGAPLVFPLGNASGFSAGMENDAVTRALHELFARSQSEQHGPPPTSKAFLDQLPVKTWDVAACAAEKYTDCPICLSEFETADQVLSLPCGHAFHKDCALPWLRDHNVCPTCRYQLPTLDEATAAKPTAASDASTPEPPREAAEPDHEQEPEFEQMLRSLLGVRRERSPTFAEPQTTRAVRQRVEPPASSLPGAVINDDNDVTLDSMLEEEASRFVEEEKRRRDSDAALFDDVDLEELLRDAGATTSEA